MIKIVAVILTCVLAGCVQKMGMTAPDGDWGRPEAGEGVIACTDTNLLRNYHLNGEKSPYCYVGIVNNAVPTDMVLSAESGDWRTIYHIRGLEGRELFFVRE